MIANAPLQPMPFVGRQQELAEINSLLDDPACRLLTLVGPGGIGKTRLALEAVQHLAFPKGIHFVPLQPLNSPDFMVPAIAEALNFQFYGGGEPKQQLLDYLRDKSLLLMLDNFEHLLDGVDILADMLACAVGVKLLTTSRERLNLREEWVLNVEGLAFPTSEMEIDISDFSAVQLFLQNARRVQVGFNVAAVQEAAVTRICRLVGGMPLGIELAAAWVRALPVEEIASEIERSLDILETPARNVEPRHRTMRAAFEPTWARLTHEERRAFRKLSVFRGGFTREAAQYVAGASLRTLTALVDKSLLRVDTSGRYDLHELLRQYGEEQLTASPDESQQALDLHCKYYAEFLHQQEQFLKGRRIKEAMNEISRELDNVRAAWQWATDHGKEDDIDKATDGLWFFYSIRGRLQEGEQAFAKAVASLTPTGLEAKPGLVFARMLTLQGAFHCYAQGRPREARILLEDSLAILRQFEPGEAIAVCLRWLGAVAVHEGNYVEARQHFQQSLALLTEIGNRFWTAYVLGFLGISYHLLEDDQEAKSLVLKSLMLFQEIESYYGFAVMQLFLAIIALALEEYEEARQLAEKSLLVSQEIGFQWVISRAQIALADVACAVGDDEQAWRFARQALSRSWVESRDIPGALWILPSIANLLAARGEIAQALDLLALAIHHPATHGEGRIFALRLLSKLETTLPSDVVTAAIERGKTLELETVVEALLANRNYSDKAVDVLPKLVTPHSLLTERELQILQLVGDGLSNREIAEQLVFSVNTVKWYVKEIFSKLHVNNRTQAVTRARSLGLLN